MNRDIETSNESKEEYLISGKIALDLCREILGNQRSVIETLQDLVAENRGKLKHLPFDDDNKILPERFVYSLLDHTQWYLHHKNERHEKIKVKELSPEEADYFDRQLRRTIKYFIQFKCSKRVRSYLITRTFDNFNLLYENQN